MADRQEWEQECQPFERDWHNQAPDNFRRNDAEWSAYWDSVFEWARVTGPVLDIGCGSRPPLVGRVKEPFAIEPLAGEFEAPAEWTEGIEIRKLPAEEFVPEFERRFATVLCWNVLDHTYDPRQVLCNIARYLRPDGVFYLATDTKEPRIGHPGVGDRDALLGFLVETFNVREVHSDRFNRDLVVRAFPKGGMAGG